MTTSFFFFLSSYPNFTNMSYVWSDPPLKEHIFLIKLLNGDELFNVSLGRFELGPLGVNGIIFARPM